MSLPAASNKLLNGEISEEIRNEINRFESVHPSIYTVYDLIELINNENLQNRLRQQVVSIEGLLFIVIFYFSIKSILSNCFTINFIAQEMRKLLEKFVGIKKSF